MLVDPHDDCQNPYCTRINGRCVGMHCSYCGEPCSMMGHPECLERHRAESPQGPDDPDPGRAERIANERAAREGYSTGRTNIPSAEYERLVYGEPGVPD